MLPLVGQQSGELGLGTAAFFFRLIEAAAEVFYSILELIAFSFALLLNLAYLFVLYFNFSL